MLPCIVCKKHATDDEDDEEGEEEEGEGEEDVEFGSTTPTAKAQVKSLSSQLKDVVLKVSAAYRQCRPCASAGSSMHKPDEQELTGTSDASSSSDGWINNNKLGSLKTNHVTQSYKSSTSSSVSETTNKQEGSPRNSQLSPSTTGTTTTTTTTTPTIVEIQDDTGQEWVAQVEPGVLITFIAMPNGENELKRIRFSRELFNKWQAEAWWGENCERVHELYNVSGSDRSFPGSRREGESKQQQDGEMKQQEDNITSSDEKQRSDELPEWVEEDEPGVYITVRLGPKGNRELKRVRFSRERFSEKQAKLWWERNRFRIHDNYL